MHSFLREPIFFMQSCGEVPCGSSQSYLTGAGGVRGVCHTECGLCAPAARESLAGRDMRAYGAGEAAEPPTSAADHSKEPQWDKFQDYLKGEVRFASVAKQFPKEADELFAAAQENAQWRYKSYLRMLGTAW